MHRNNFKWAGVANFWPLKKNLREGGRITSMCDMNCAHMRRGLFASLFLCLWGIWGWAGQAAYSHGDYCIRALSDPAPKVFRVVTFNTQNLHIKLRAQQTDYVDSFHRLSRRDFTDTRYEELEADKNARHAKSRDQIERLANAILDVDPDIAVLQEVDSMRELHHLNRHYFSDRYHTFLQDGNDRRGFEIGFFVRKDIDLDIEYVSHKELRWVDPVTNVEQPLFSRDAPALILRKQGQEQPMMIIIGHHAKSKAPNQFEPDGARLRTAQHNALAALVTDFQDRFGDHVPIVVAGDYNTDIHKADETESLRSIMHDVFDMSGRPLTEYERITHSTFVESKTGSYGQYDGILVSRAAPIRIQRAGVQRDVERLARSQKERNKQISDHFLVYADIELFE